MGTTVATNALLERRMATPPCFVTTPAFADALRIGYPASARYLCAEHSPLPEFAVRAASAGRSRAHPADGAVERADRPGCSCETRAGSGLRAPAWTALAIVFMHGYAYPAHERAARKRWHGRARLRRRCRFRMRSAPLIRFVEPRRHHRGRRLCWRRSCAAMSMVVADAGRELAAQSWPGI